MVEFRLLGAGVGDLAHGVQYRGVVAATEQITDFRQAFLGQLLGQVHGDLARQGDIGGPAFRIHVGHLDLVEVRHGLLDVLDRDLTVGHRQQILQRFLADIHREHVAAVEAGIRQHLAQRAFQFADVAAQMLGDEERHFLGHGHALGLGLAQQDRHPHFQLGRLDRHRQAGIEARDQAAVDARQFLRIGVAGDDDLLALRHHRLEGVEELFLRAVLAGEELDVVDQEQVQRMVVALEIVERLALVGLDHVGHVLVGMHVAHAHAGTGRDHGIADGVDQVGLAQAHAAVQEQRVVGRAGVLGHLQRGGAASWLALPVTKFSKVRSVFRRERSYTILAASALTAAAALEAAAVCATIAGGGAAAGGAPPWARRPASRQGAPEPPACAAWRHGWAARTAPAPAARTTPRPTLRSGGRNSSAPNPA